MTQSARGERWFRAVSGWLSVAVAAIGLLVLAGWIFHSNTLERIHDTWAPMRPNTAILLVALVHVWFMVLEMILWDHPVGRQTFNMTPEFSAASAVLSGHSWAHSGHT